MIGNGALGPGGKSGGSLDDFRWYNIKNTKAKTSSISNILGTLTGQSLFYVEAI